MDYTTIGIDVSKHTLDICFLPSKQFITLSNDMDGYKRLINLIDDKSAQILMESTGIYHKNAQNYLQKSGYSVIILNPKHVRDYAKSCGRLAKTDRTDAFIIAKYGQTHDLRTKTPLPNSTEQFKYLITRRRQMIKLRSQEKMHIEKYAVLGHKSVLKSIQAGIKFYDKQLQTIDKQITGLIEKTPELKDIFDKITTVNGVGFATAIELMADMPELGRMNKREVAALAGIAPMNCDSGAMRGQRHIRGGRPHVRRALYMACVCGIRCNAVLRTYYQRLRIEYQKPFKVAIVAVMRKLLIHLNSICGQIKLKNYP